MLYSKIFKAIHKKCLDCSGDSLTNLKMCPCSDCPLFPYRFGHEPDYFTKKDKTPEPEKSKPNGQISFV